jgi:hypothetical protein
VDRSAHISSLRFASVHLVATLPTSTSAHPMSRHNFDRAHSTKLFATKIGMCAPGPNPTTFPFFFVKKYAELGESCFTHCHAFQANYSHGQAKPTNPVYWSGVPLEVRFLQILTQIVEISRKTLLQSFSHDVLDSARILGPKTATSVSFRRGLYGEIYTIVLRTVENNIQMHHGSFRCIAMTFLLAYGPLRRLSRESHTVC